MTDAPSFEWDGTKDRSNRLKHGVSFAEAQKAFFDSRRVIAEDLEHSDGERRYFLLWQGRGWCHDGPFHLSGGPYSYLRRRLLAERKKNL